jgi:hypothetical protein
LEHALISESEGLQPSFRQQQQQQQLQQQRQNNYLENQ